MSFFKRHEAEYFTPPDVEDYGDPSDHHYPTSAEEPSQQYDMLGVGVVAPREEVVGRMTVIGHGSFPLTDRFRRRVVVGQNKNSGRSMFVAPGGGAAFGWDQGEEYEVPQTWNPAEEQEVNTFAFEAELREARAPLTVTEEKWKKAGGDPKRRSSFHFPNLGIRRDMRTGHPIVSTT